MVSVRPAGPGDCEHVWRWNNHPDARAASLTTADIPLGDHQSWYASRLLDPDALLWVIEADGVPAGVVRFQREDEAATVSIAVAPEQRGRGIARAGLGAALCQLPWRLPVLAWVLASNLASSRLFEGAGFGAARRQRVGEREFVLYRRPAW
jgi:L-amino acid N-acyltransferase YncA